MPNSKQRIKLNQIFGAQRTVYNKLVAESKEDAFELTQKELDNKYRYLTQKNTMIHHYEEYIYNNPEEVFNSTYRDFKKAIVTTKALSKAQKSKTGKGFVATLKFKSKKNDPSNSIEIGSRSIKQNEDKLNIWPTFFYNKDDKPKVKVKDRGIKFKGKLPKCYYSCRLQKLRTGEYYLCIPTYKNFNESITNATCSLDPGVRTFQTLYDPDGSTFDFGTNFNKIIGLGRKIDQLQSILSNHKNKKKKLKSGNKYRIRREKLRTCNKIKKCINDFHHKVSKYLSTNYKQVLLPKFETKQLSNRIERNIGNKTVRSMMTWSHYKFKKLLEYKMSRTGGRMIECTEEFTSKTCSRCGRIKHNLGGNKVYSCLNCGLIIDRDVNGARNIYLKNCLELDDYHRD